MNAENSSETNAAPLNGEASSPARAGLHEAVDKAAASAGNAALSALPAIEGAAQTAHRGVDYLADAMAPPTDWVRQHPMQALGLAFATGFLLGRLGR